MSSHSLCCSIRPALVNLFLFSKQLFSFFPCFQYYFLWRFSCWRVLQQLQYPFIFFAALVHVLVHRVFSEVAQLLARKVAAVVRPAVINRADSNFSFAPEECAPALVPFEHGLSVAFSSSEFFPFAAAAFYPFDVLLAQPDCQRAAQAAERAVFRYHFLPL